jgi:hypothetical protein
LALVLLLLLSHGGGSTPPVPFLYILKLHTRIPGG